ncbi:unnamed protein product, partial [Polarella glacialis]
ACADSEMLSPASGVQVTSGASSTQQRQGVVARMMTPPRSCQTFQQSSQASYAPSRSTTPKGADGLLPAPRLAPPLSPEPWSGASPRWGAAKQPLQPRLQVAHSGGQPVVMRPPPRSWQPPLSPTRGLVRQPSQSPTRLASISPTRVAVTRSVSQSPPSAPMQALAPELASGVSVLIGGCRCLITEPLGMGSFGVVWAAKCDLPAGSVCSSSLHEVAVKEIRCRSEVELSRA